MAGTNKYFDKFHVREEQNLVEDLYTEAIECQGADFVYLPRTFQKQDLIYGEDVLSKFDDTIDIDMYIKSVSGFEGRGDIMSKFGIDVRDQAVLQVSKHKWNLTVGEEFERPREGDLIYYPLNGALFEIKFVTHESIHYQLGATYVFELTIEQYVWSEEKFDTGIDEIQEREKKFAYTLLFNLGAGTGNYQEDEWVYQGTSLATATAKALVSDINNPSPNTIKVRDIVGDFVVGEPLIGDTSGASYTLSLYDKQKDENDLIADTERVQGEADDIVDFTEKDPFSEGGVY